ncbi:MarR family transcriptional regulator [Nocardiopsis sp. EMB25]|uniref:MarR family winged helix-turn-helix transcriptional regulator n=1 Tax=Nocardiopsis TaxID=2013 RepID=UPI000369540A|nr:MULTISPECIES: MarR family transcriptional regulator [Nocardiopsis]MCY9785366.1 MarR family transcriptional regulator [Nocardiopsis sp. EMB25]
METAPASPPGGPDAGSRTELYDALQDGGQRLAVGLVRLLHRMAALSGMNPTDFQCYTLLRVSGTLTPGEIADSLCLSTGSVTGVLDRLEERGLVERTRHPGDRRKIAVRLTEGADRLASASSPGMRAAMTELHDHYSDGELAVIADWLDRVGATLDGVVRAPRPPA